MLPDDPRHGEPAGYDAGCRNACCRAAAAAYERQRRYDAILGRPARTMPAIGTQRRAQALVALGYTFGDIARELGVSHDRGRALCVRQLAYIRTTTAIAVADLYERLCMTPAPDGWHASYARTVATRHGWAPPLAWDNIDDPNEQPSGLTTSPIRFQPTEPDMCLVDRILDGSWREPCSPVDKAEVVRRWVAAGRPVADLERRTGWNAYRYMERTVS